MTKFFTGKGDDGSTGLLGEGRVPKYDPRPAAYGAVDETSAVLGLARASFDDQKLNNTIKTVQRDLYQIMAELAATQEEAQKFRTLDESRLHWLEEEVEKFGTSVEMPKEFVVSGDTSGNAAFDVARTVVRRAEREVAFLNSVHPIENEVILPYLNRLSSLCFVLSLWVLGIEGVDKISLAKSDPS